MEQERKRYLTDKGRRVPIAKLLSQGRATVQLCRNHADELGGTGWPAERTDTLEQQLFALDALFSGRAGETEAAIKTTVLEAEARQDAKSYIRRLRRAVRLVLKRQKVEGVTASAFNAGERLGHSTPKISKYLMTVRPFVQKMDESLKVYFGGNSALSQLEAVKTALDTIDAAQETARSALPEETANLYLSAGEILDLIEEVNSIAQIAFDGSAEIAAQFNKDLTLRGRKTRASTAVGADGEVVPG